MFFDIPINTQVISVGVCTLQKCSNVLDARSNVFDGLLILNYYEVIGIVDFF